MGALSLQDAGLKGSLHGWIPIMTWALANQPLAVALKGRGILKNSVVESKHGAELVVSASIEEVIEGPPT